MNAIRTVLLGAFVALAACTSGSTTTDASVVDVGPVGQSTLEVTASPVLAVDIAARNCGSCHAVAALQADGYVPRIVGLQPVQSYALAAGHTR